MSLSEDSKQQRPEPYHLSRYDRQCIRAKKQPFLDEKPMSETAAACAWQDFRHPLLGRFTPQGSFEFMKLLGFGLDGAVWKVRIDSKTYALKVFWHAKAPEGSDYWALQRECHNAALIAKMRFAIENSSDPIWLNPNPKTFDDAVSNLHAFSNEGRSEARFRDMPGAVEYRTAPRLRECFGWTSISGKELWALPRRMQPPEYKVNRQEVRYIFPTEEYRAIVYEYVPSSETGLDAEVVQAQLDFFWLGGWCMVPMRIENWGGAGILLDMADAICFCHVEWHEIEYWRTDAGDVMEYLEM
ncbi:hypothetical protein E4U57_003278 [Claviceps arundinis]|uniref:Aminoglycoside phosphotransferase domain-containing protein n=1 Tax=Claviceps arundinis TaxID=1623583 RepID=A0ABQ7PAY2_9HYPO|nr:hypothetical protein E4U57_003278 [Claviceps arundinis]